MLPLWLRILDILDRMMNSGQTDSLEEAIPESLKNILLVMADGGYLVSPDQDPSKEEMWNETRKRLGRFLPELFGEIFPDAGKEAEKSQPPSAVSSPQPDADVESQPEEAAIPSNDAEESKEADGAETKSPLQEKTSS